MRSWLYILAVTSLLGTQCATVDTDCNPNDMNACGAGKRCVSVGMDQGGPGNRCKPVDGNGDVTCTMVGKTFECTTDNPICGPNMVCATCATFPAPNRDDTCKGAFPSQPFCKLDQASAKGACVQCRGGVGCSGTTPLCNEATNTCLPCRTHDDCKLTGSDHGICRLTEFGVSNTGACLLDNEARVVSGADELNTAINDANGPKFIAVKAGTYNAINVTTAALDRIVVGSGLDAVSKSVVTAGLTAANFTTAGKFLFDGVNFSAGVICGGLADLSLWRSRIDSAANIASLCGTLTVASTHIVNVQKSGIVMGSSISDYRIFNSLIQDSAAMPATYAVEINSGAKGLFAFNTLVRNRAGGVYCRSAVTLLSSIISGNGQPAGSDGAGQGLAQISSKCTPKDLVLGVSTPATGVLLGTPMFVGFGKAPGDYKLKDANQACCTGTTAVDARVPVDFFSKKRGGRPNANTDVGFAESP